MFTNWELLFNSTKGFEEATQILLVITVFIKLFLIKDLFSEKTIPLFTSKRYLLTTFYITSGFIFLVLVAKFYTEFNPAILLGSFILIWVNDSFAYLIGKNFGKQKLFPRISPKKTWEGSFGGGLLTISLAFILSTYFTNLDQTNWIVLAIIVTIAGGLGDLVESMLKRSLNITNQR